MDLSFRLLFMGILMLFFSSCNRNRLKVDISDIKENVEIVRFEQELFDIPLKDTLTELTELREKQPDFFDLFTYKVIRIGGINEEQFPELMGHFLTDTMILNVKKLVDDEFSDFESISTQINKAFKYYKYHFPDKPLPSIYTCVSGFNQSIFTAEKLIGISLDKYLGADCNYYKQLSTTPMYKIPNMNKNKIVSDLAYGWGITEFSGNKISTNLLGNMIQQGKIMYFVDALLPSINDTLKIGYSKKQLDWCVNNEAQMWLYLVENKMLYSNKRMDIVRYINDAPYTSGFPMESPGRTGVWIGWQIVRKYMKNHPEITLAQLMENYNYQEILNASKYYPE